MLKEIVTVAERSADTIVEDVLGVLALICLLGGALLLPGLL